MIIQAMILTATNREYLEFTLSHPQVHNEDLINAQPDNYIVVIDQKYVEVFPDKIAFDAKYRVDDADYFGVNSDKWVYVKVHEMATPESMKVDINKLPINSVIEDKEHGWWMKGTETQWHAMSSHCVDCIEVCTSETRPEVLMYLDNLVDKTPEEFFLDFAVMAIPPGFDLKDAKCSK